MSHHLTNSLQILFNWFPCHKPSLFRHLSLIHTHSSIALYLPVIHPIICLTPSLRSDSGFTLISIFSNISETRILIYYPTLLCNHLPLFTRPSTTRYPSSTTALSHTFCLHLFVGILSYHSSIIILFIHFYIILFDYIVLFVILFTCSFPCTTRNFYSFVVVPNKLILSYIYTITQHC